MEEAAYKWTVESHRPVTLSTWPMAGGGHRCRPFWQRVGSREVLALRLVAHYVWAVCYPIVSVMDGRGAGLSEDPHGEWVVRGLH